jgi:sugar lactone lactonase YvrE
VSPTRALFVCLVFGAVVTLSAAAPTFWEVSTEADFLRGDVENLSIDSFGRVTLGPSATPAYETNAPFVWTVIGGPDGSVFAGSGNEGQVYRIDAAGRGSVFFDSDELEVHALALAPGGGLYAGTSPNGRIYKVDAAGAASVFFDPADRYIWSLAVDASGNVFAATGDKGVVYKITPEGIGTPFYETRATHAMTLAFDREGRLLVGSDSPGRVFRLDSDGRPFVLLDSAYEEIRALRVDREGRIYAAAIGGRPPAAAAPPPAAPEPPPAPTATVTTQVTVVAVGDGAATQSGQPAQPAQPSTRTGQPTGAIFRILPDGVWDLLWESRSDTPYDMAIEVDDTILVATGNSGKIFRLSGDPYEPALAAQANAQQITSLLPMTEGRVLAATSNPGRILRITPGRSDSGRYTSEVRDAQTLALWGTLSWEATTPPNTRIEISTRSGNTSAPDETWSDWSAPYQDPRGSAIASPRARYLQWRAILSSSGEETPVLTSVTAAYLPRNIRPRVTSITIHPPGTVFQRPFPTDPEIAGFDGDPPGGRGDGPAGQTGPALGRRTYQKGLLTFVWRAQDDNGDTLHYDVLYRREGETSWRTLRREMSEEILVWDTTSVPNGRYTLRIVASDAPANSPDRALTGSRDSASFDIDNVPPAITVTSVRREGAQVSIAFDVTDLHSVVERAEYSLGGDRWQAVYPKDGIADSRFEQFELVLEGDAAGREVILRATDALNNSASTRGETAGASGRR